VLSTFDWQLVNGVIVHHLCNAAEWLAKLSKNKTSIMICYYLHVHEAFSTPVSTMITTATFLQVQLHCVSKRISNIFSCNSNMHHLIFIIFIDRIAAEIIRLVASMCVRVYPFAVGTLLFELFDL